MARLTYATVLDAHRKFDPSLSQSDLGERFTAEERTVSILEEVEAELESRVGKFRASRHGNPDAPQTWDTHTVEVPFSHDPRDARPVTIDLGHENVLPIDPAAGDAIKLRRGHQEDFEDITDDTAFWELSDPRNGRLTLHLRPRSGQRPRGLRTGNIGRTRHVRLTYRYGNLGGSSTNPGETTLATALTDEETGTVDVADATRLPSSGTMLVDSEYVYVSDVDEANDTITIEGRGKRRTTPASHETGARVHYCPMHIRSAVAAKAAIELHAQDDKTDFLTESDHNLDRNEKIRQLEAEWDDVVDAHSDAVV